ncbi:proline--tRNA ligase [Silvibacterium sp.]|uniref:proline--tRNA ligase n=1 Tax=Silvibacterium sp. TaxID=1964179 RepID=UPI0039E2BDA2
MQRWSKIFVPTLREAPADAEVASHKFLLRAGYVRQLGAGIYSYLFFGNRSIQKIVGIVREEMNTIGQEFLLPGIMPSDVWEQSGRWTTMGQNMFRLQDRKGAWLCLGMTHEEVMTDIARKELRSYKQLPQIWYQIQTKFRDEPRPKSGLLRVRQFIMKDSYSFDLDAAGLDKSFDLHDAVYRKIFSRCGLSFVSVEADSGAMGGTQSQEFMVYTDAGEDLIASCPNCGYAANMEKATSKLGAVTEMEPTGDGLPELVHTPGKAAIADVAEFFQIDAASDIKTVAYMAEIREGKEAKWVPLVAFLRGDHFVNETKLGGIAGASDLRPMNGEELEKYFAGPAGYLGPIGLNVAKKLHDGGVNVIVDLGLEGRKNLVGGANKLDYHFRNITPGRDFTWTLLADIRNVAEGEGCPQCGTPLKVAKAVEIGHIFKLGYKYSESMGARVLDPNGKEVTPIMGSYGIGIERILTSCIEQNNDENGFWLPPSIAPFEVVVTLTNIKDEALVEAGSKIAAELEAAGFDVLLDDRDERAGVKFKDADLVGIPYRVTVGKKIAEGKVELVTRAKAAGEDVAVADVVSHLKSLVS